MEYTRYVWDSTVWFLFFLVSEVYAVKWKDVKEVLRDVFLFAIVLVNGGEKKAHKIFVCT